MALDRRTRRLLIERLNRDGAVIAHAFALRYRAIEAERSNVTSRYGVCFDDGTIKIRLHHAVTGEPLRYSSLVNTLCHELAHLRHFDHGPRFKAFYLELLAYARQRGLYRPAPRRPAGAVREAPRPLAPRPPSPPRRRAPEAPLQLTLF